MAFMQNLIMFFRPVHKLEWYNFLVANNNTQVRQSNSTNFKLFYEPEKGNLDLANSNPYA